MTHYDGRGRTEGLVVVFDGGTLADPAVIRLPPEELADHAFVDPVDLGRHLPGLQARRAAAALRAAATGRTAYLEDGREP